MTNNRRPDLPIGEPMFRVEEDAFFLHTLPFINVPSGGSYRIARRFTPCTQ
ncbi:hypothetical protein [uncultured Alcanivorax sp.]|uniref:hypothetical protein n=1 Tax=uncultured Alcanivorax sp. TaxID=191215 RepID=UPI0032B188C8